MPRVLLGEQLANHAPKVEFCIWSHDVVGHDLNIGAALAIMLVTAAVAAAAAAVTRMIRMPYNDNVKRQLIRRMSSYPIGTRRTYFVRWRLDGWWVSMFCFQLDKSSDYGLLRVV